MVPKLISEHGVWLSAFLRGLTRSEADAEDAYQDIWLRLVKRGGIPEGASPRAYLAKTARSVVIDRYRRKGPKTEELSPEIVDESEGPDRKFERSSTRAEIRAAIRALPEKLKTVVLMRIEAELTFEEIAVTLEIPLGTALTRMRTATTILKRKLGGRHG